MVSRSPSHSATAPWVSNALCNCTGVRKSRLMITSAASSPAAMSPRAITTGELGAKLPPGRTFGAPGATADSNVAAKGVGSYCTTTARAARTAAPRESAQTAAIGWPAYETSAGKRRVRAGASPGPSTS